MKKLSLGLLLTVGTSAMCAAILPTKNAHGLKTASVLKKGSSNQAYNLICNDEEIFLSCYDGYVAVVATCDGRRDQIDLGGHSRSCSKGEDDGLMTIHVKKVDGCKAGPLNDFNSVIEVIKDIL